MARKTPDEKRREADRDEARGHLRAATKALSGRLPDDAKALAAIDAARALVPDAGEQESE
jgi:hypothetical protein